MLKKICYILFIICLVFGIMEMGIRASGKYLTYTERVGGNFLMEYERSYSNEHLFIHAPNRDINHKTTEFDYICPANQYGFRDDNWNAPVNGDTDHVRIFIIGDSFIEGVGSECDKSMPSYFEKLSGPQNVQVYNAGISGSDVFYSYKVVDKVLLGLEPDIILLGVNNSDIYEHITRGGFERFKQDGITMHRKSPIPLKPYEKSHVFRFYTHEIRRLSRYTFLSRKKAFSLNLEALDEISSAIVRTDSLCRSHEIDLYAFYFPVPSFVDKGTPDPEIDLLYQNSLESGVKAILLSGAFNSYADTSANSFSELYWPEDGHFNNKGYDVFANLLFREINDQYSNWLTKLAR